MRKIIHLDADCFYAAVETLLNPALKKRPMAVGGMPSRRGVIATCNYEARSFGVRSAMSSSIALKQCPELIILPPRISTYRDYSKKIFDIYREYSPDIEPLSLDEAFLDVTDSSLCKGSATLIAQEIRDRVFSEVGLHISAGVAPLKFLAKVASDWNKPNGMFVIKPEEVDEFIKTLSVSNIPGVGKVTTEKLARHGIYSCHDVVEIGLPEIMKLLGKFGVRLFSMCSGIDNRVVRERGLRKSLSVETTFSEDINKGAPLREKLIDIIEELHKRFLDKSASRKVVKRFIKLKFSDFSITTAEALIDLKEENIFLPEYFFPLLDEASRRGDLAVRLLGAGVRFDDKDFSYQQLSLPF